MKSLFFLNDVWFSCIKHYNLIMRNDYRIIWTHHIYLVVSYWSLWLLQELAHCCGIFLKNLRSRCLLYSMNAFSSPLDNIVVWKKWLFFWCWIIFSFTCCRGWVLCGHKFLCTSRVILWVQEDMKPWNPHEEKWGYRMDLKDGLKKGLWEWKWCMGDKKDTTDWWR